jgi:hypothetical protein
MKKLWSSMVGQRSATNTTTNTTTNSQTTPRANNTSTISSSTPGHTSSSSVSMTTKSTFYSSILNSSTAGKSRGTMDHESREYQQAQRAPKPSSKTWLGKSKSLFTHSIPWIRYVSVEKEIQSEIDRLQFQLYCYLRAPYSLLMEDTTDTEQREKYLSIPNNQPS